MPQLLLVLFEFVFAINSCKINLVYQKLPCLASISANKAFVVGCDIFEESLTRGFLEVKPHAFFRLKQKGSTGSVLKTTTAYGSSSNDRNQLASQFSSTTTATAGDFDSKSVDSEESEKQLAEPTSVHEMRAHHQCCRLNNSGNPPSTN